MKPGGLLAVTSSPKAVASDSLYSATELNHVTIRVSDLKRSKEFYQQLLGLAVMKENAELCYLRSDKGFYVCGKRAKRRRRDSIISASGFQSLIATQRWRS